MRAKSLILRAAAIILIVTILFHPVAPVMAASDDEIRLINMGIQSVLTLVCAFFQGNVHSAKDVLTCLSAGAASGYGFYEAKKMAGRGQVSDGVLLANLSASVSENTALFGNPFAYIGYSVGPLRFRLATPFASRPPAILNLDVSFIEAVNLAYSVSETDGVMFRDGLIAFEKPGAFGNNPGQTMGMFPRIQRGSPDFVWRHETVHAIQAIQLDSTEIITSRGDKDRDSDTAFMKFGYFRLGVNQLAGGAIYYSQGKYEDRWAEAEAYHFARIK